MNTNLKGTERGNGTFTNSINRNIIQFGAPHGLVKILDSKFEDRTGVGVSFIVEGEHFEAISLNLTNIQIYFSFSENIAISDSTFIVSPVDGFYGLFDVNHFSVHESQKNSKFSIKGCLFQRSEFQPPSSMGFTYLLRSDSLDLYDTRIENFIFGTTEEEVVFADPAIIIYGHNTVIHNLTFLKCKASKFIYFFTSSYQSKHKYVSMSITEIKLFENTAVCNILSIR
jgi:hypothetical protein